MKFNNNRSRSTSRGPLALALAGALIIGFSGLGLVGGLGVAETTGRGGNGSEGGGGSGGGWMTDEEAVGTLPTHGDEGGAPPPGMNPGSRPSFFVEGPKQAVRGLVIETVGEGFVTEEQNSSGGQETMRLGFHGDLRVTLDASFLDDPAIVAGVQVENQVGQTIAVAMTDNRLLMTDVLPSTGTLVVPFDQFEDAGLLEDGVRLLTNNMHRGRDYFGVERFAGMLDITQGGAVIP